MTAVDTNVVVRLLTDDDPVQSAAARKIFASGRVWIAKTVLLETCWVLRSLYGFSDDAVRVAFLKLLGLENVQAEDAGAVAVALELNDHGVDFADGLHLSSRPVGADFVSFDQPFIRRAKRAGAKGVVAL